MPTIPDTSHGFDSVIKVDDAAGSLVDLSAEMNAVGSSETVEVDDDTAFGSRARSHSIGMVEGGSIELAGNFSTDNIRHMAGIWNGSSEQTVEYSPAGTDAGRRKATAETIMTGLEVAADIGSNVQVSTTHKVSGDVTHADH